MSPLDQGEPRALARASIYRKKSRDGAPVESWPIRSRRWQDGGKDEFTSKYTKDLVKLQDYYLYPDYQNGLGNKPSKSEKKDVCLD